MPKLFIIAGANGAGKSTSATRLLAGPRRVDEFVNADVIARDQRLSDVAAGRQTLERLDALARARRDIAFETTLSSKALLLRIERLRRAGYRVDLTFFWLPNADMAVERVRQRVATGGHHIPEDVVRRRYDRGLENFFNAYADSVDAWELIDNTARTSPRMIAARVGKMLQVDDNPLWNQLMRRYMKPRAQEPSVEALVAGSREDAEWQLASDPRDKLKAVQQAVQEAITRHRQRGEPLVVWENGKIVWLKPGEY